MNKKRIILISIIISFSLLGTIFVQSFWVQNAIKLKEEQFNKSVLISLKTVVNQLLDYQNNHLSLRYELEECKEEGHPIVQKIKPAMLDELIHRELSSIGIEGNYQYGIYHNHTGDFLMGNFDGFKNEIIDSEHYISLTCLYKSEQFILSIYFSNKQGIILKKIIGWLLLSVGFLILMTVGFYLSVSSILRQKRLSVMKTDFVNNMTHEFKTPISTISLASEMLVRKEIQASPAKTSKYANIIFAENDRLKNQVEHILQIAVLDKGDFNIRFKQIDLHNIIEAQAKNFKMILKERNGELIMNLNAVEYLVNADRVHVMNMVSNLLDNAVKYTPYTPKVEIITKSINKGVFIIVKDNGIGVSSENQKHIFKNLYRVPTGNIHDVKGFGLGLYYVKTMMEAHNGSVSIKSEPKKGSEFELFFPFNKNVNSSQE